MKRPLIVALPFVGVLIGMLIGLLLSRPQAPRGYLCRRVVVEQFDQSMQGGHQHAVVGIGPVVATLPDSTEVFPQGRLCAFPSPSSPSR